MPRRGPTKCSPRVDNLKRFDHPNVMSILLFGQPFFEPADALTPSDYPAAVKWWQTKLEAYRSQGLVPFIDTIYSPDDDTAQAPRSHSLTFSSRIQSLAVCATGGR